MSEIEDEWMPERLWPFIVSLIVGDTAKQQLVEFVAPKKVLPNQIILALRFQIECLNNALGILAFHQTKLISNCN
jgi:hypothetical protein